MGVGITRNYQKSSGMLLTVKGTDDGIVADPETLKEVCQPKTGKIGENKMENTEQKKGIGDYLNSGVDYLKAMDFEIGEERKYKVIRQQDVDFGEGAKALLVLQGLEGGETGLVLNRTNLDYLKSQNFETFEELYGKHITIRKEERVFEGKQFGKRENVGLFIVKVQ